MVKAGLKHSSKFQAKGSFLQLIRLMTAVSRSERPTAKTVWNFMRNPTFLGKACGICCIREEVQKAESTEWSGVQPLRLVRPRSPFDSNVSDATSSELTVNSGAVSDETRTPYANVHQLMATFDWAGQGAFHVDYDLEEDVPVRSIRVPGHSTNAVAELVSVPGLLLAQKSIRTGHRLRFADVREEVGILQSLEHNHILQVIGSYTTRETFSILLHPSCDHNLDDLLQECADLMFTEEGRQRAQTIRLMLKRSMQCLAQALGRVPSRKPSTPCRHQTRKHNL
jgi:hypothetical protein